MILTSMASAANCSKALVSLITEADSVCASKSQYRLLKISNSTRSGWKFIAMHSMRSSEAGILAISCPLAFESLKFLKNISVLKDMKHKISIITLIHLKNRSKYWQLYNVTWIRMDYAHCTIFFSLSHQKIQYFLKKMR